jgi:GTP cyclohydrolase I
VLAQQPNTKKRHPPASLYLSVQHLQFRQKIHFFAREHTHLSFQLSAFGFSSGLCPCSKSISDYGAHNQRGYISLDIRPTSEADGTVTLIWLEELITIAEQAASCPVYPLLKRQDERHVTMQAYDKPAFVEDMVRDCAVALRNDPRVDWFRVNVENHESIHNHAAFAEVEWRRG